MLRLLALASLSGCVIPYALPPLKGEFGGSRVGDQPVLHAAAGANLASATTNPDQAFDVGVGGVVDWDQDRVTSTGAYVEGAAFVERSTTTRTSVGARGELRYSPTGDRWAKGYGAKLRVEHEYFAKTHSGYSASDRCAAIGGGAHGTGGFGLFAEAGRVTTPMTEDSAFTATVGVTLRVPATAGLLFGIPGCR